VETLAERLDDRTLLVSVMHANNEVGTMNDVRNIGRLCREAGAIYHCDAVQTFTVLPLEDAPEWADLLSVSAHKIYGPKGVGALFVRAGVRLEPLLLGGGQERELRAGTEDVAGIVGFAAATELALADSDRWRRTRDVRDHFVGSIQTNPQIRFTVTSWENVLPGHAHLRIPGRKAETVLIQLDRRGIAASSGAACSSGSVEPSHVLMAMGFSEQEAAEGIRFSFGKDSTREDAEAIVSALFEICGA
jgi:cysteine desulfurase